MTELLFFKRDHSSDMTLSAVQLSALPNVFDLVVAEPDGWNWSNDELTNPWFRIITWPLLVWPLSAAAQAFLETSEDTLQTHHFSFRKRFLNLNHATIPAALKTWWLDDTRAVQKFNVTLTPGPVLAAISVTRTLIPKT